MSGILGGGRAILRAACGLVFLAACGTAALPLTPYSRYDEDWRQRVERTGAENYPAAARGLSGSLRLTVAILPDGSVQAVKLDRSSGQEVLDRAAFRIIELASPFAAFPPEIRRQTDLYVITRTWFFGPEIRINP